MTASSGEQLKLARLEKGLSLEQASKATHIRVHYLKALENDERTVLPSKVQGRGFLRLYAGLLDLPIEPLLAQWDGKQSNEASLVSDDPITPPGIVNPEIRSETPGSKMTEVTEANENNEEQQEKVDSELIFREIGKILRSQRDALGLSIAEVERYTHIRQIYIISLEEGKLENLPSPVQARGMLSNFAKFLNLDEDNILLRYAEGLQARRIEKIPKVHDITDTDLQKKKKATQAPAWRRFITPDLIFGIGLAAVILFFILWTLARIDSLRKSELEPTIQPISNVLLTPAFNETVNATTTITVQVESWIQDVPNFEQPLDQITATSKVIANDSTDLGDGSLPEGAITISPLNTDPFQIYIIVRQRAWLKVIADDKVKFLGRVVPGNAYAFSGTKRLELLTGNAAGLQIFYNQMDLGILGSKGQVVGLVFASEGIMTPTSAFTLTSAPTRADSITPLPSPTALSTPSVTPFVP